MKRNPKVPDLLSWNLSCFCCLEHLSPSLPLVCVYTIKHIIRSHPAKKNKLRAIRERDCVCVVNRRRLAAQRSNPIRIRRIGRGPAVGSRGPANYANNRVNFLPLSVVILH
jgi:hypothetical protein